jgi:hypothetical protein
MSSSKKVPSSTRRRIKLRDGLKMIGEEIVRDTESGNRFYHKHLTEKARIKKRLKRKAKRRARRVKDRSK